MEGEGMVAVVRGLRDSGLAVTLLDSGRQYTLLPESVQASQPLSINLSHTTASQCSGEAPRESAVQATDGRYASTYKLMHCHVTPTSPPDQVTEFPPQRAEIHPGCGNFEVGGQGSGENHCLPARCSGFRGAMCWPDRGAIFSPRPSIQPDSFANSLRKYPSLSQERSSEIVERLINFTQTKNSSRNRPTPSPTRNIDSDTSTHIVPLEASRQANRTQRYEAEVNIRPRRLDESPTKDRPRKVLVEREPVESWRRSTFSKTNDVRYLRDVSRKPNHQPERQVRERFDSPSVDQRRSINPYNTNSVNMEIQAAVQMVSREIVTVPRIAPSQRTVAVPLTPTSSFAARKSEGSVACTHLADLDTTKHFTEFVQTNLDPVDINIQTVLSAMEVSNHKCRHRKRCKSQDEIRFNESMKNEILHLIQRLPLNPNYCAGFRLHRKSHNRSSKNFSFKRVEDTKHIYNTRERRLIRDFSKNNSKCAKRSLARIFHAKVSPYGMINKVDLAELLQDWINLIPFNGIDDFSINIHKESLFYELFEYIKNGEYSLKGLDKGYNLKTEIINKLESMPLEIRGNRWVFENRLADILVDKINKTRRIPSDHLLLSKARETRNHKSKFKLKCLSMRDIRNFVLKELSIFVRNSDSRLNQRQMKEVENELIDLLCVSAEMLLGGRDKHLIIIVMKLLVDYGVPEHKAICFSNALIRRFRDICIICRAEGNIRSETFIVLSNTETVTANYNATNNSLSIKSINEDDIQANVDSYTKQLCVQIDDWLSQLPISIPQDKAFRQVVVNDLAGEIVDRHRYIELNPNSSRSNETELEHFKYQIFKWINKFVGDDNLEISRYAPDLMRRINDIPVPMLSRLRDLQNANANNSEARTPIQLNTIPPYDRSIVLKSTVGDSLPPLNIEQEQQIKLVSIYDDDKEVSNQNQNSKQCCSGIGNQIEKTIDKLEAEYIQYLKDWVKLIPIEATTPEEQAVADKARLGIHNGIWKLLSKLDCDPATYNNRFFYEDLLDDGIEELLDCLPQIPELLSKKHALKSKLVGKTTEINELIRENERASFRHKLKRNIFDNLRKLGITRGNDSVKMYEDMQVKKIVEEFLLCTSFRTENKVKAEIYKKKLLKHIETFIADLKQHHPQELNDINISLHKGDILNILLKVRLPCEYDIKEEADSILLDLEIDQWYSDLPNVPSDDYKDQYQQSKQRENLAKKVKEFENDNNDFSESALRLEVLKFLEKAPLKEGENLNKSFMVEQFINRIKNRPKHDITQNTKKVAFQTIPDYEDFSKDVSFCSSFIHPPKVTTQGPAHNDDKNKPTQCLKSCGGQPINNSLKISENNVSPTNRSVVIQDQPTYRTFNEGRPISSSLNEEKNNRQWHTLDDVQTTSSMKMYSIPPYHSLVEQRTPQRQGQQSLQRPPVVENKTCYPNLDNGLGTEEMQSTNAQLYPQKGKESYAQERIKTSKGILGTSQIAGPSGYNAKFSNNVNNIYYKPETYEPPPNYLPGPSPCDLHEDSASYKTKRYSEQMAMPQMPIPQIPMQQMPIPQMPTPQLTMSRIPTPQMPTPQMPMPQMPIPQMPMPQMPMPQMPMSQMTMPQMTMSQMTMPQMPTPRIPTPQMSMRQTPIPQMPQTSNECSAAFQTYDILQPDPLRADQQNASTNTTFSPPVFSSTHHVICPNVTTCPNIRRDNIGIYDKRRHQSLDVCEENNDEVACHCIEKYFRKSKRYPCENYNNYPPYIPMFFPYPCFF